MAAPPLSSRLPHNHQMSVNHDDSMISQPDAGYLSQENSTEPDDRYDTNNNSKIAYALRQPEMKSLNDPYTYQQAQAKYRRQGDPHMDDYARSLRNRVNIRRMAPQKNFMMPHNSVGPKGNSPRNRKRKSPNAINTQKNSLSLFNQHDIMANQSVELKPQRNATNSRTNEQHNNMD